MAQALVLGGGGVAGIAWITGLLTGMADAEQAAIIEPDEASRAAAGANPLDPSTRKPAAEAGRAQGRGLKIEWSRT